MAQRSGTRHPLEEPEQWDEDYDEAAGHSLGDCSISEG